MNVFTFDAKAALQQARSRQTLPTVPTVPTFRAGEGETVGRVGTVGTVCEASPGNRDLSRERADGLSPDDGDYFDLLSVQGSASYGAMATALGWGATRAWLADARLQGAGLTVYRNGRAYPSDGKGGAR